MAPCGQTTFKYIELGKLESSASELADAIERESARARALTGVRSVLRASGARNDRAGPRRAFRRQTTRMGRGVAARDRRAFGRTLWNAPELADEVARAHVRPAQLRPVNPRKAPAVRIVASPKPSGRGVPVRAGRPKPRRVVARTKPDRSQDLCEARDGSGTACRGRAGEAKTSVAPTTQRTTLSGGSLGSHVDEERS